MSTNPKGTDQANPTEPRLSASYLDHNGAQLFYETSGRGAALTLIHAGIADHTMWDPHLAAFARSRRVLRYDLRGFGKSVTLPTPFSNGDDLLALFDHLEIERTALIGVLFFSFFGDMWHHVMFYILMGLVLSVIRMHQVYAETGRVPEAFRLGKAIERPTM